MPEPVHQPFGCEIRRRADGQDAGVLPLQQPFGSDRDPVERIPDDGQIVAAGFGDDQALAFAIEQLDAELDLERLDLMTDGALGDEKLFRRAGKTLVPRRGLEGLQGIERGEALAHDPNFMRKTRAGARNDALPAIGHRCNEPLQHAIWSQSMSTLLGNAASISPTQSVRSSAGPHQSSSWRTLLYAPLDWMERRWRRQSLSDIVDDPRRLSDVGLTRDQVVHEINKPFWS